MSIDGEPVTKASMSKAERKAQRLERKEKSKKENGKIVSKDDSNRDKFISHLSKNPNELLKFVVKINKLYEEELKMDAPFMTWVLIGMQSSGKSTFMERLLNAVLNIVQEGTGTRCPLDVTCIHDEKCTQPSSDLSGDELDAPGEALSNEAVFHRITEHNKYLANLDKFSTKPLKLVYRAQNVQNMRFVDTPGIISNQSTGKDNREDIKAILKKEIAKPNTKLCVLLEATEFAKNPIIDFLDESLDGREGWINDAKFLMTKFDKQMEDSRTPNKANTFFSEFLRNRVVPHLVITPTLEREDLDPVALFEKRNENLAQSTAFEESRFDNWLTQHQRFRDAEGSKEILNADIEGKIGFSNAHAMMRKEMLEHTMAMLPVVIASLQSELSKRKLERQELKERQKFTEPSELKVVVNDMLHVIQERLVAYLDGDLLSSIKFNDQLQTLDEEIESEEDCPLSDEPLGHSENEDDWRNHIASMGGDYPEVIQPDMRFLGGKQVHRAIEFFGVVMIDSLPDPEGLEKLVPNAVGYGGGGLMRENWEGATKQICKALMQKITHPGINYLVKHIGYILQRLFHLSLEDIMEDQPNSKTYRLLPDAVQHHLIDEFNNMLLNLMNEAAKNVHTSLKPMYSTIDPNLPTFMAGEYENDEGNDYENDAKLLSWAKDKLKATFSLSSSEAKNILKEQSKARAKTKKSFLQDQRTSMITEEETKLIVNRSFQYLVALMEFFLIYFRLQINCFLYEEFKLEIKKSFVHKVTETNWSDLVVPDATLTERIDTLDRQIKALESSLQEVQRMNQRM